MIRVREEMDIIILDTGKIKVVEKSICALRMDIVVGYSVHNQESHTFGQRVDIVDASVVIAFGIVLRSMHVSLSVDGV